MTTSHRRQVSAAPVALLLIDCGDALGQVSWVLAATLVLIVVLIVGAGLAVRM